MVSHHSRDTREMDHFVVWQESDVSGAENKGRAHTCGNAILMSTCLVLVAAEVTIIKVVKRWSDGFIVQRRQSKYELPNLCRNRWRHGMGTRREGWSSFACLIANCRYSSCQARVDIFYRQFRVRRVFLPAMLTLTRESTDAEC